MAFIVEKISLRLFRILALNRMLMSFSIISMKLWSVSALIKLPITPIEPLLPLANLKRETILCSAQTIFQNKLSEVLYEDSGMVVKKLAFPSLSEDLINELKNLEDKILKEVAIYPTHLLNFRTPLEIKKISSKPDGTLSKINNRKFRPNFVNHPI